MGIKYSFDARFEFARRLSATFQRSALKLFDAGQVVRHHSLSVARLHLSLSLGAGALQRIKPQRIRESAI